MSSLNASPANPATPPTAKPLLTRVLAALGTAGLGAFAVLMALSFLPPNFVAQLLAPAIPSAIASDAGAGNTAMEARRHRLADALHVQHGTYVSDPYGCLYMFQYLEAKLSLTPVRDEHGSRVCAQ